MKLDVFGWNYEIDIIPYIENIENIKEFSYVIDKDLNCFGCGFLLAFFYHSKNTLQLFYNKYGYFPYDSYLDLWTNITSKYDIYGKDEAFKTPGYNDRNKAIEALIKSGLISRNIPSNSKSELLQAVNNPYEKIVNRNNNLNLLIE